MIQRIVAALCLLAGASPAPAAVLPVWAREVVGAPTAGQSADAVVLFDHVEVTLDTAGRMRTTRRYAVAVRDRAGRDAATIRAVYVPGSGSVKAMRGWIVKGTAARDVDQRAIIDAALMNDDIYNDVRVRSLSATGELMAGETFVAEVETEERVLFSQLEWQMQASWPVRLLRRTLVLPQGWIAKPVTFNAPPLTANRSADTWTWERRDVPALPDEPSMPPASSVAPRLAVSVFAPAANGSPGQFDSWRAVSQWLHELSDGAAAASPAVTAKARALAGMAGNDFERAAAIARYVQGIQYISIQTGLGRGGGYQPRPASVVFERNYGDCKDKASLMRAMLAALGIRSHLLSLYSGDRDYVRADWPSPQQFNHAIIAVALRVPADRVAPVIEHAVLGSLVIFDPTDPHTRFGELPLAEQGSLALIVHPSSGELVKLPLLPIDRHAIDRTTNGVIDANGSLTASIHERYLGDQSSTARAIRAALDAETYRDVATRRVAASVPRARVTRITPVDPASDEAAATFEFEAAGYATAANGLLLVAMPFEPGTIQLPDAADRQTPVLVEPKLVNETVRLRVAADLRVDEAQPPVRIESPFGRYSLEVTLENGLLQAKRRLELPLQQIEPAQLAEARAFFDRVRSADTGVVVLARK